MRNVTVRQLQMFVAAAEAGSFTRAAEKLHVSPAAVSFQIKQMEDGSGFSLFERIGKKVAPTEAGRALLGYASTVLQALHDADQSLMALRGVIAGRASIGAVSTAKYIVPHIMARFQQQYPGVAIDLRFGNRRQISAGLARGEIELAIMGRPPEESDLTADAFAVHPTVLVASPAHRLAAATDLRIQDLAGIALITREEGSGTRLLTEQLFADAAIPARIVMTTDSNETIKQAVMAGMGLAILSRHTVGLEVALGLLKILPLEGFPLMRSWFVAHRRAMPLMPAHARLRAFFQEHGQTVIDELELGYQAAARSPLGGG
ncbi:MAG TPA: LysR substrate-binding domain-containing protein, partial [Acetobacteraceae bacterium]|nr:LysR substrate-binding domain-containing protein [Acetobacteraceae bacterium]